MTDKRLIERVEVASARYLVSDEVCAMFHITRRTLSRWCDAGKLHPMKAGRRNLFEREEVEALASASNSVNRQ